jgi:tetratricopeptide (TPR) repeat protein
VFDALARIPLTPQGTLMVAAYNIRQGRADQARTALNEALRLNPMDRDAKAMLDALNQGQTPEMKPQWSFHMQGVSAGVGLAFMDLAQMMVGDHAADSALIFAQLGRMIRPDVPGLSLLVGNIFEEQGRDEDAAAVFSSVQPGDIDYIDAQVRLAELRAGQDKPGEAIQILESLMEKQPNPRVAYALGEIYRENKDYKKAVGAYDQAVGLSGGKADDELWSVYFVRAMAYDSLGEWPKAEADLKTALEYRPDNPQVLNFLAYSWADKSMHLKDSQDMLARALARAPSDAYITDSMGWVFFRQGDYDKATTLLERAVSLKPYDPVLNDHLGDVYAKTGRTLEARYQWQRALDYADKDKDSDLIKSVTAKLKS